MIYTSSNCCGLQNIYSLITVRVLAVWTCKHSNVYPLKIIKIKKIHLLPYHIPLIGKKE